METLQRYVEDSVLEDSDESESEDEKSPRKPKPAKDNVLKDERVKDEPKEKVSVKDENVLRVIIPSHQATMKISLSVEQTVEEVLQQIVAEYPMANLNDFGLFLPR